MTLIHIPANASVFVDANVLIYHFTPDPALGTACQLMLDRVNGQEVFGFTSTHVVSEVAHRMMALEAMDRFGWPQKGIAYRLRQNPEEVKKLVRYRQVIDEIPRLGIDVLPVPHHLVAVAGAVSQQTGLLSGDALVVAVMQDEAIMHLASHDGDFDRVPGITRYSPL
jgi:predicted nucleic acid-binding protein